MKYLLDTHTLLWYASGDERLPSTARQIIQDVQQEAFVSIVTLWEIAIKLQLGKLNLGRTLDEFIVFTAQNDFRWLGITPSHILEYALLPLHHKDPFDRMLIAQTLSENMLFIGCDSIFDVYSIQRICQ
ncbi:MAG: type II toxin-antitoxin system VapC family toxin [Thermoguttaceae bacterium]